MRVDVYSTYIESMERKMRDTTLVVIDVLRSSSSIIEAIENGVRYVIPVSGLDEAVAIRRARGGQTLLAGERNGEKIEGFDLGNSPLEFTARIVKNRVVVMCTTNGTDAVLKAGSIGDVWVASLRNRKTLCEKLVSIGKDISIICAGSESAFSADDTYAAGSYISKLREMVDSIEIGDLGLVAENFYLNAKNNGALLCQMQHYRRLCAIGMQNDIDFCFIEDKSNALGIMKDSITIVDALK